MLTFLGMMLLWDVSPYPVYLCLVNVPSELILVVQDSFLVFQYYIVLPASLLRSLLIIRGRNGLTYTKYLLHTLLVWA